jgi:Arc/MetJ-type ribon-helix-helix transcriptional regulator
MEPDVMTRGRLPVSPDNERLTVTLPRELAQRVRDFWHARQYKRASDAVVDLLRLALDEIDREEQRAVPKKPS